MYSNTIKVYDISAGSLNQVSSFTGYSRKANPDISGDRIVWADWRNGNADIYMYDFVAGIESRVTSDGNNQSYPAIDGNKIVWGDNRNPNRVSDIYVYDLENQTETRITDNKPTWALYPAISGNKIIWWDIRSTEIKLGVSSIHMYDLETQVESQVTSDSTLLNMPGTISISNNKVVWSDWRNGNVDIYINDLNPNVSPVAEISSIPVVTLGQAVNFDGSQSSDMDGTIASYQWELGDGTTGSGSQISHAYALAGTYQVILTVTDDQGATATDTASVLVNTPPVAIAAPVALVLLGQPSLFDGSGSSDADGTIATYGWNFGDGMTGSGVSPNHTYTTAGTYEVTLVVTDNAGATATATVSVRVNAAPVARIASVPTIILGESANFDGSGSTDAEGPIAGFSWDLGDNALASGSIVNHTYAAAGIYQVVLTVTDSDGATGTTTQVVNVQTPVQSINDLVTLVQSMNLARGISNSLDTKLQNAASALSAENAGDRGDAINKLQAFINATQAQSGNQLTAAQANQLIAAANRIIAIL